MLLLTTKLHAPRARAGARSVVRPRLVERLNAAQDRPLLLISAPAGSGKTTLLVDWIAHNARHIAWLALDEDDNDPARFWTYFIAALQTVHPAFGKNAQALLAGAGQPSAPRELFLTALLNELAGLPDRLGIVLDDYHVISAPAIHEALIYLIEHLPPQMQVIINSRSDPPLPLARFRAGGLLSEFRTEDLRFRPDEAASFLNQVMRLELSTDEIAALEARTEGWIVGLQLAALSLHSRDEQARHEFVAAFTGSQRFILDYLVEEVLQRQPE